MYFIYVVKREDGKLYIGYTSNIEQRLKQHKSRWNMDVELMYYEAYLTEELAMNREKRLKFYGSAWRGLKKRIGA